MKKKKLIIIFLTFNLFLYADDTNDIFGKYENLIVGEKINSKNNKVKINLNNQKNNINKKQFLIKNQLFDKINISYVTYKLDYKEYNANTDEVLDGDSTKFGDMNGVKINLSKLFFDKYLFTLDYLYVKGKEHYKGQTWGGTPIELDKDNSYILNYKLLFKYYPQKNPFYIGIGKRKWLRNSSGQPGDYWEIYKFNYWLIGLSSTFKYKRLLFNPNIEYQKSYKSTLNSGLVDGQGNNVGIMKLYGVTGFNIDLPLNYELFNNFYLNLYYRYQYWEIKDSEHLPFTFSDGSKGFVYEPPSKTHSQIIGLGFNYYY